MNDLNLVNYYRILNPDKKVFTWRRKNPVNQGRLDYILTSDLFSNIVENFYIRPGYRSDHSSVLIELRFNSFERGCGLWKFNNNLLHDKIYVETVKKKKKVVKNKYYQTLHGVKSRAIADDSVFFDILETPTIINSNGNSQKLHKASFSFSFSFMYQYSIYTYLKLYNGMSDVCKFCMGDCTMYNTHI